MLESIASIALMDAHSAATIKPAKDVLMGMPSQRTICVLNALEQHTARKGQSVLRSQTARKEHLASPLPRAPSVKVGMVWRTGHAHNAQGTHTATMG